jgi:D-alanyl-D-alanine dipeptidase
MPRGARICNGELCGGGMRQRRGASCKREPESMRRILLLTLILTALSAVTLPAAVQARELPGNLVYLRDIDPSIAQDMRYATADNFTGAPLPGYDAGECILRRDVAQALRKVQAALAPQHLSLKVYDCYRPTRAVAAMARWAQAREDGATRRFYPALDKRTLFSGYISARSAHSTGTAVDLTLVRSPEPRVPPYDARASYGPCTAPSRAPDSSLDMGAGFDCFDARSHTASPAVSAQAKRTRGLLGDAMRAQGFKNYFREWWHFSYGRPAQENAKAYDVPIAPR